MWISAGQEELRNRALRRKWPEDFGRALFSAVVVRMDGNKKKELQDEWRFLKSLPGRLCDGKEVVCACLHGPGGLDHLTEFAQNLSAGEVVREPVMLSRLRSMAVLRLSGPSLPAFAELIWESLFGVDVALAIAPRRVSVIEDALREYPLSLFKLSMWRDFWLGASRMCEMTMQLYDGEIIEIHSLEHSSAELKSLVRSSADGSAIEWERGTL